MSAPPQAGPSLPAARGAVSAALLDALRSPASAPPGARAAAGLDPYGDDLQLALYTLYELHYRGFAGVADEREWDPALLALRRGLEERFEAALRRDTPRTGLAEALDGLLVEDSVQSGAEAESDVSRFLRRRGELWQLREYAAVRSLYHLKEADPHAWVIPRLRGRAKAAMVAVEYDEFGAGRADRVHAALFAALMDDLGVDTAYGRHVDAAPAEALATVNLMSLLGLHRALRGALVGHFATVEITSSPASERLAHAMRRTGAGPAAEHFYTEHVEADAVHEQVVRREVIGGLLDLEPALAPEVAFGVHATVLLDGRLGARLTDAWRAGRSALREPSLREHSD
ncbi:iron-containing redox enzyme family protein [Streptomyces sp. NPDC050560]|uniref:iron-containing redox enzyme family protein n=1 Tax=Streptomyces sp. NPDC050560 TaxID=3365630 RepID=UPI0037958289